MLSVSHRTTDRGVVVMAVLAAPGDTWGIDGPTFLFLYLLLAAVVLVAAMRARRRIAGVGAGRTTAADRAGPLSGRPQDVAYLHGGPELAVWSALSAMHLSGTIATAGRGVVQAVGRPENRATELERAIHATATSPTPQHRLRYHGSVAAALDRIRERLVAEQLLLSEAQRDRIRRIGGWMLAVAVFGLVRIIAGVADARPIGFLVAATVVVAVIGLAQLVRVPQRTVAGQRALEFLRDKHSDLSPSMRPDWVAHGAGAAALGVGVFGMGALWASDPAFADELAAQKAAAATGGWSGGYSDSGSSSWTFGGAGDGGGGGSSCGGGGGGCGGGGGGGGCGG